MANWSYFQCICVTLVSLCAVSDVIRGIQGESKRLVQSGQQTHHSRIAQIPHVLSTYSAGYRHEGRSERYLYPDYSESIPDDEPNRTFYHQLQAKYAYEQWARNNAERRDGLSARSIPEDGRQNENLNQERISATPRPSPRTDNGTFKIINITPAPHQSQTAVSKNEGNTSELRDSIVFPGPTGKSEASARHFAPVLSDGCKQGRTLCLAVANYPENYITDLLSNSADDLHHQLSVDELEPVKISQRIGDDPDEFELCAFQERVVYPQAAQNKESKWLMIVNQVGYKQGFRVEICHKENSHCSPAVSFRLGMEASCKQKYVLRKMAAIDESGQLVMDNFRLPSCCSCVVRYVDTYGRQKRDLIRQEP